MTRPWTPSAALKASFVVHGGAALGVLAAPACWPWALGALAANHAVLTTAGLLPRSGLLGPNITRLPPAAAARGHVTLSFDDGPDPTLTPQVLDLLDAAGARASFFCIGWRARAHPALCSEIAARGHQVENHGDAHSKVFSLYGPRRMRADVAAAQATLAEISGRAPRFFRPTAGLRNLFLEPVLARQDLRLASWTRRGYDTREPSVDRVLQRLTRDLADGDILLLHDGHAARTGDGRPVIEHLIPRLARRLADAGLASVTLHEVFA